MGRGTVSSALVMILVGVAIVLRTAKQGGLPTRVREAIS